MCVRLAEQPATDVIETNRTVVAIVARRWWCEYSGGSGDDTNIERQRRAGVAVELDRDVGVVAADAKMRTSPADNSWVTV